MSQLQRELRLHHLLLDELADSKNLHIRVCHMGGGAPLNRNTPPLFSFFNIIINITESKATLHPLHTRAPHSAQNCPPLSFEPQLVQNALRIGAMEGIGACCAIMGVACCAAIG
eukprot:SAG31_NODE_19606_length_598_cov_0.881526_2_plen_113_part_01